MNWENNGANQNNGNPQQWSGQQPEGAQQNNPQYQPPYQPQYPPSYQPPYQPQYQPQYTQPIKKDRSDTIKKIIIIASVVFIVAMLVTVFIELMKPAAAADIPQSTMSIGKALNDSYIWINSVISHV